MKPTSADNSQIAQFDVKRLPSQLRGSNDDVSVHRSPQSSPSLYSSGHAEHGHVVVPLYPNYAITVIDVSYDNISTTLRTLPVADILYLYICMKISCNTC